MKTQLKSSTLDNINMLSQELSNNHIIFDSWNEKSYIDNLWNDFIAIFSYYINNYKTFDIIKINKFNKKLVENNNINKIIKIEQDFENELKKLIETNWNIVSLNEWEKVIVDIELEDIVWNKYNTNLIFEINNIVDKQNFLYKDIIELIKKRFWNIINSIVYWNINIIKINDNWPDYKTKNIVSYIIKKENFINIYKNNDKIPFITTWDDKYFEWLYTTFELSNKIKDLNILNKIIDELNS